MFIILSIISLSLFITLCFTIFLIIKNKTNLLKIEYLYQELDYINNKLHEKEKLIQELESMKNELNIGYASTNANIISCNNLIDQLHQDKNILEQRIDELRIKNHQIITENELIKQTNSHIQEQMHDWEKNQTEILKNTKAAIVEISQNLSTKLLDDHKREANAQKEEAKKTVENTQKQINEQFEKVVNIMSKLDSQVKESQNTVDIVKRSLLSPAGAGSLAEITLENILKASGLNENKDYFLQYHIITDDNNNNLRPDAVLLLPGNNKMIIDSKASKFFLEMGHASTAEQDQLKNKLKDTINNHIKDLQKKDYRDALKIFLTKNGEDVVNANISMIMFLPTDSVLSTILEIMPNFYDKCWSNNIYPCGPSGLANMLAHAKFQVLQVKQADNYQKVLYEVQELINNISTFAEHAVSLGNSINQSLKHYDKIAATFNRSMLARAKNLNKLGVIQTKNKQLPNTLERYQTITIEHQQNNILEELSNE